MRIYGNDVGRSSPMNHLPQGLDPYRIALRFLVQDRLVKYLSHHIVSFRRWNRELKREPQDTMEMPGPVSWESRYFVMQSIVAAEFEKLTSAAYDMTKI